MGISELQPEIWKPDENQTLKKSKEKQESQE